LIVELYGALLNGIAQPVEAGETTLGLGGLLALVALYLKLRKFKGIRWILLQLDKLLSPSSSCSCAAAR